MSQKRDAVVPLSFIVLSHSLDVAVLPDVKLLKPKVKTYDTVAPAIFYDPYSPDKNV